MPLCYLCKSAKCTDKIRFAQIESLDFSKKQLFFRIFLGSSIFAKVPERRFFSTFLQIFLLRRIYAFYFGENDMTYGLWKCKYIIKKLLILN